MNNTITRETESVKDRKADLLRITKEIENQISEALVRKSTFSFALLEQVLELYTFEVELIDKVRKLQGKGLHDLRLKLFELFTKTGRTVSDEVLKRRISELILKHISSVPRGGRPRKRPL
jgi:hypothetical protein